MPLYSHYLKCFILTNSFQLVQDFFHPQYLQWLCVHLLQSINAKWLQARRRPCAFCPIDQWTIRMYQNVLCSMGETVNFPMSDFFSIFNGFVSWKQLQETDIHFMGKSMVSGRKLRFPKMIYSSRPWCPPCEYDLRDIFQCGAPQWW